MFFNSATRSSIERALDNAHETFGRSLTAYKDAEKTVTLFTPQYNAVYGTAGRTSMSVSKTTVSSVFTARIRYFTNSETILDTDSQSKVSIPEGLVRIKVDAEGKNFIRDAKRIDLDGKRYLIVNDSFPQPIKPYIPKYFAFFLSPIDEKAS